MESLILYYPEGHQKHYLPGHPERPQRVEVIKEGLEESGIWGDCPQASPIALDWDLLSAVHSMDYLTLLQRIGRKGGMLDPDTYVTPDSWQLALNAAGGAAALVDQVWEREAGAGFALTRPPGHHATRNQGMGFCLINNIALAAEYVLREKGAEKIAIVDLDLHHGNGTQQIFWDRAEVCYISIHQAPFYPGTGSLLERGGEQAGGSNLNLPIPAYSGDQAYQTLLEEIILNYLEAQAPEMVLISFGFDTHWRDPLGSMQVSGECVYQMIGSLSRWSGEHCSGRIAVLLEGGYDLEAGKLCGGAVAAALLGRPWQDNLGKSPIEEDDGWEATLQAASDLLGLK